MNMKFATLIALAATTATAQTCDRACLEGMVDQYMEALIAHKQGTLPLAQRVKNTEDGVRLEIGDGFWRTAMGKGTYRLFNTDAESGQVVFQGTMREASRTGQGPVIVMIRLKVANRQITEIENFVVRDPAAAQVLENRGQPDQLFKTEIPATQRATRAALIQTANAYFSGIEKNNGKGNYPLADDCVRLQNGTQTTNNAEAVRAFTPAGRGGPGAAKGPPAPKGKAKGKAAPEPAPEPVVFNIFALSCTEQFKSGYYNFVTRVRDRRFVAVDRERGLVTAILAMDQPSGKYRNFKMADGKDMTAGPEKPSTLAVAETFKIEGGKIRRVDAVQLNVPYGMVMGWSSWEDGMSSKAQDAK
jgi:hypothetical protein